jgi:hypothetical protein
MFLILAKSLWIAKYRMFSFALFDNFISGNGVRFSSIAGVYSASKADTSVLIDQVAMYDLLVQTAFFDYIHATLYACICVTVISSLFGVQSETGIRR